MLAPADSQSPVEAPDSETCCDPVPLQRVQALPRTLAGTESVPVYCIVQNRPLEELARRLPTERHALLQIHGIGEEKARKYGEVLLDEIRDHLAANQASPEPL